MMFSKFYCTLSTLNFEKSSNTTKNLEEIKKNLPIILSLKWPLLEPKMFIVFNNAAPGVLSHFNNPVFMYMNFTNMRSYLGIIFIEFK